MFWLQFSMFLSQKDEQSLNLHLHQVTRAKSMRIIDEKKKKIL